MFESHLALGPSQGQSLCFVFVPSSVVFLHTDVIKQRKKMLVLLDEVYFTKS